MISRADTDTGQPPGSGAAPRTTHTPSKPSGMRDMRAGNEPTKGADPPVDPTARRPLIPRATGARRAQKLLVGDV